jgi:hypothetical protein
LFFAWRFSLGEKVSNRDLRLADGVSGTVVWEQLKSHRCAGEGTTGHRQRKS